MPVVSSNRRAVRVSVVAAWASLAVAALAGAQTPATSAPVSSVETTPWTITAFIGPGFGADLNNSPLNLGVAGAYNLGPKLSIEGEFAYTRGAQQGILLNLDTGVTSLAANVVYHFDDGVRRWVPYGTIGIGMLRGSTNLDDLAAAGITPAQLQLLGFNSDGTDTSLGLNLGGGVKTRLNERVAFRGDLRYFSGRNLAPSFWRAYVGLGFGVGR
jgi:opacity protein-like surface antigen